MTFAFSDFVEGVDDNGVKAVLQAWANTVPKCLDQSKLQVIILRPPFEENFTLVLDNKQSEELSREEVYTWFEVRGATFDSVDKAVNEAWNSYRALTTISNPKTPNVVRQAGSPDI